MNAAPVLRVENGGYLIFDAYNLVEALYEAPFYWMGADKRYAPTALKHRGIYTEESARERLEKVLGTFWHENKRNPNLGGEEIRGTIKRRRVK